MLQSESIELNTAKYLLFELTEAMSNRLQHILAEQKGLSARGYMDTIAKGYKEGIISEDLFSKLKPIFEFRNSLVHHYKSIDNKKLITNIQDGKEDFNQFAKELEQYLTQQSQ
jgi:uncharacterized protein YutE (UPF0331/DUF86 family)